MIAGVIIGLGIGGYCGALLCRLWWRKEIAAGRALRDALDNHVTPSRPKYDDKFYAVNSHPPGFLGWVLKVYVGETERTYGPIGALEKVVAEEEWIKHMIPAAVCHRYTLTSVAMIDGDVRDWHRYANFATELDRAG